MTLSSRVPSPHQSNIIGWAAATLLLFIHAALAWAMRIAAITTRDDDARFLWLARSLRRLEYVDLFLIGTPAHSQYPPAYPGLLAALTTAFGERLDVLLAANIALSVMGLLLLFDAARRRWPPWVALLTLAIAAINPSLLLYAGHLLSETPFMALTMLALWALSLPAGGATLALAGAAIIAAALTRSAGVALVVALLLWWLSERRFRAAAFFALAAVATVGVWLAWAVLAPDQFAGRSYVADAAVGAGVNGDGAAEVVVRRVVANIPEYVALTMPQHLPLPTIPGTPLDNVLLLMVVVTLIVAGAIAFWSRFRPALIMMVCFAALLSLWPYTAGRFFVPLLPLLLLLFVAGALALGERWLPRRAWIPPAMIAVLIVAAALRRDAAELRASTSCDREKPFISAACFNVDQRSFFAAADLVARTAPEDAIVLGAKEGVLSFFMKRPSILLQPVLAQPESSFVDHLERRGVTHIFVGHLASNDRALASKLQMTCDRLELLRYVHPRSLVLKIPAHNSPSPDSSACKALARYQMASSEFLPVPR